MAFLFSCSKQTTDPNSVSSTMKSPKEKVSSKIMYASVDELEEVLTESKGALNWKVARALAVEELYASAENNGWQGASLAQTPIIIYGANSKPKYYEFRVIHGDEEVGAITANILPKGGTIAYVLNFARDYTKSKSKNVNAKVIANNYPVVAFGIVGKSGEEVSGTFDYEGNAVTVAEPMGLIDAVEISSLEELSEETGLDLNSLEETLAYQKEVRAETEKEYEIMNASVEKIATLTDKDIEELSLESKASYDTYRIPAYAAIKNKYFKGDCGPTVLAWIYYGINKTYKGNEINFNYKGENGENFSDGLLKGAAAALGTYNNGITLPWKFSEGLSKITDGKYGVHTGAIRGGSGYDDVRNNRMPLISFRGSRPWQWKWQWHYRVVYGSERKTSVFKILWWKITKVDKYVLMHDNGTDGGDFKESNWNGDFGQYRVYRR